MQRTQFCAKSAKNDLKPTDFLKRNFYFETEGVYLSGMWQGLWLRRGIKNTSVMMRLKDVLQIWTPF